MPIITFTFEDITLPTTTIKNAKVGDSLLDVAEDNGIHLNHNCGAVCACSTCHLYVEKGDEYLQEISDREEDFIDRARNPRLESRLGCQCVILNKNAVITVHIPDQSQIIGHEH